MISRFGVRGVLCLTGVLVMLAVLPATSLAAPATGGCEKRVQFGLVDARTDGCLTGPAGGESWTTSDLVRLNGIPIPVAPGTRLALDGPTPSSPGGKMSVTTAPITIAGVTLQRQVISKDFPAPAAGEQDRPWLTFQPERAQNLFGIAVTGRVGVRLGTQLGSGNGYSIITLVLEMPSALKNGPTQKAGGVTGLVSVRADDAGVKTDQLKVDVRNAYIGQIQVHNFCLSYTAGGSSSTPCSPPNFGASPLLACPAGTNVNRWDGSAHMTLPMANRPRLGVWAGIGGGQFSYAGASASNLGNNITIAPTMYLDKFGLGICVNPPPFQIKGAAGIRFGPVIRGTSLAYLNGSLHYIDSRPWVLRAEGSLDLFGQNLAKGFMKFEGTGAVDFGFQASLNIARGLLSVSASVVGWVQPKPHSRFDVFGRGRVCAAKVACANGEVAVSSIGLAGCIDLGRFTWWRPYKFLRFRKQSVRIRAGAGFKWGGKVKLMGGSCDAGAYRARKVAVDAQVGETRTVELKASPGAVVQVKGEGSPPKVELVSPDSKRVIKADTEGAIKENEYEYGQNDEDNSTDIEIVAPEAGAWTIRTLPGSSTVTEDSTASLEPEATALGEVTGTGHERTLKYGFERSGDEQIQIVEEGTSKGESYYQVLGSAGGSASECPSDSEADISGTATPGEPKPELTCGSVNFSPALGPAGERRIMGVVLNDGEPVNEFQIATYDAPANKELAEPGDVTVQRNNSSGETTIKWARVPGAENYNVSVDLSDGESLAMTVPGSEDSATVPVSVAPGDTVIARVAGLRLDEVAGPYRVTTSEGVSGDQPTPEAPGESPS